jgi:hypothetical protein
MRRNRHLQQMEEARRGFNRRRRKCRLTFNQLWNRFRRSESFAAIAQDAGVARSRMRIIYELWFRKLLHLPSGQRMREKQQQEKRNAKAKNLKKLPRNKAVTAIARAEGRKWVKPAPRDQRSRCGEVRVREVWVRGLLYGVHHLRNVRQQRGRYARYSTTTIHRTPLERQDMKSFYIETPYGNKRVDMTREELLARFKPGQQTITVWIAI